MNPRLLARRTTGRRVPLRAVACAAALLALPVAPLVATSVAHAAAPAPAGAFTQKLTKTPGTNQVTFSFTPAPDNKDSRFVDVHYVVKGAPEGTQSFRMTRGDDGTWSRQASLSGPDFEYWYTYADAKGAAVDTGRFDKDGNPQNTPPPPDGAGAFPLKVQTPPGKDLYLTVVGQVTPGHYSFLRPDGTTIPVYHPADGDQDTEHKDGKTYPKMSFKVSGGANGISLPPSMEGGRIFVSDQPLLMDAARNASGGYDDSGYVQPDANNPQDPNRDTRYDFFEFTYRHDKIAFGGNTTQVDGFSLPMTAELKQDSSGFDKKVGIAGKSASEVIAAYKDSPDVGQAFKSLVNSAGTHISAPRSSPQFRDGGASAHYFDATIDKAWEKWASGFTLADGDTTYRGATKTGADGRPQLAFTRFEKKDGKDVEAGKGAVNKPSTADVAACAGALASGSDTEKFVEARLCAAFNRGVALNDPATWSDASRYYAKGTGVPFNDYAAFFHSISLDGLAYAFPYDDVHEKSSVMILPNADTPTSLTLTLGG
ncbi:beta-1,3-glucanase family protein [Streptomyces sp. NPDC004667]|uniref:beta-1,3-glucanase family protein n=1 Tax=Streptomyces sp. NPDC004667 TaxID=3154285 RepID=UPI00339EC482